MDRITLGNTLLLIGLVLPIVAVQAEDEKAPVHPTLVSAKTFYLLNDQDDLPVFDRLYSDLKKWGRYEMVSTPEEADVLGILTMQVGRTFEVYNGSTVILGSSAITSGSSSVLGYKHFYFKIFDMETKMQLWTDGEEGWWTNKGAVSKLVKNLRNRLPKN